MRNTDPAGAASPEDEIHDRPAGRRPPLTLVTVVFEAELALLTLQARSLERFVDRADFTEIVVIDNTHGGLGARRRRRLTAAYGTWWPKVSILRPGDIAVLPAAPGWTGQQVLKLMVHRHVRTPHYLVLDAKNHWVRPTGPGTFVDQDGRARGASHSYRDHALRDSLVGVLDYLGVEPEPWLDSFPVTHTPVVLCTAVVARLTADIEQRSGRAFAAEFVRARLTEFFLYAGWIVATYGRLDGHLDGTAVRSATVWPSQASAGGFARTLDDARRLDTPFVSVHRTALARADRRAVGLLADFWCERGLFGCRRDAIAFVARYKLQFLVTMSVRRLRAAQLAAAAPLRDRTARRFGRGQHEPFRR